MSRGMQQVITVALPVLALIFGYLLQPTRDWLVERRTDRRERRTSRRETLMALQAAVYELDDMFVALTNETNLEHVAGRPSTRFGVGQESGRERGIRTFSQKVDRLRVLVDDPTLRDRIVAYQTTIDVSLWTHENFEQRKRDQAQALTLVNDRLGELLRGLAPAS